MKKTIIGIIFLILGLGLVYAETTPPGDTPSTDPKEGITVIVTSTQLFCGNSVDVRKLIDVEKMTPIFLAKDNIKSVMVMVNPESKKWIVLFIPLKDTNTTCIAAAGENYVEKNDIKIEPNGIKI